MEWSRSRLYRIIILALLWLPPAHAGDVLAVMYFDIESNDTELQRLRVGLADMMTTDLDRVDGFEVVERKELAALLAEQDLGTSGRIDKSTAVKIGKMLGAHYMVFGSGLDFFGTLRLDARVVSVETGAIMSTASAEGPPKSVFEMKGKLVEEISAWMVEKSGSTQAPKEILEPTHSTAPSENADPVTATLDFAAGLELLDAGDVAGANAAFDRAVAADSRLKRSVAHARSLAESGGPHHIFAMFPKGELSADVTGLFWDLQQQGVVSALTEIPGYQLITAEGLRAYADDLGIDLLPQTEEESEVHTGRNLGFEKIITSSITGISGNLMATLKFLDTESGALVASRSFDSKDASEILERTSEETAALVTEALAPNPASTRGSRSRSAAVKTVPTKSETYEKSHALVIGIDNYQHLSELKGAVRDAKAMSTLLKSRGFEVSLLLNKQATKTEIEKQLSGILPKIVGENDRVLIYFAGHGVPEGDGEDSRGYLMPVEAAESWQGLAMDNVMKELRVRVKARHILYLADACYSGLGLSTRSVPLSSELPDYLRKISQEDVRLQFTAGGKGQQVNEYTGRRGTHGLFTYHLLDGLEGAADTNKDGVVTSAELWPYLQQHVAGTAVQEGWDQTPQYGREGEGEFLFFLPQ